jgi:hypothetical protein
VFILFDPKYSVRTSVSGLLGLLIAAACPGAYCQSPPAFVQGAAFLDTSFSARSVSVTFPVQPAPGHAVIVGCMGDGGSSQLSPDGVTDNQSNTYTQVVFQNYIGSGQPTALYIATNIASAGTFIVSCAGLDQVDALNLFALEYSGLANTDVVDAVSTGVPQSGTYPRLCENVTTTDRNDLIVALFNNDSGDSSAGIAATSDYSLLSCAGGAGGMCAAQDGSKYQLGAMIGRVADEPDTYGPGFASGPGGMNSQSICVVAAFKGALK